MNTFPARYLGHRLTEKQAGLIFAHGTINILSDAVIVFVPVFIIWKVQIPRQQKLLVAGLFFARLW
jgi:hypothetical protein